MRKIYVDILASFVLIFLACIFFARLFTPIAQLIVTPDYGRSDAWHFSFPTKFALFQSLSLGELPVWRSDIGDGFPLLAEGQTGAYYLPNLILFRLLDPVMAYNISLVFAISALGIGVYFLARKLSIGPLSSLFAGITVMFSGLPILQLPHITLLQSASLLPFITLAALFLLEGDTKPWLAVFSLLLTQQIFTGFPQLTFLTLLFVAAFTIRRTIQTKSIRAALLVAGATALGILGGSAQLFPSYEFLQRSINPTGFDAATVSFFSMPITHLASFILPFALGNPRNGTYPSYVQFDGSIFWENTAYIGILPIIAALVAVIRLRKDTRLQFLVLITVMSLLFAWGKYSPFYVLYSLWPLTLFRVPSRFLWLTVVTLVLTSAHGLNILERKKSTAFHIIIALCITAEVGVLWHTWWSYNLMMPARNLLAAPDSIRNLPAGRVYTLGMEGEHNATFVKQGWQKSDVYFYLYHEAIAPDSNMLWSVPQHDLYAGRYLLRPALANAILGESLTVDQHHATASSSLFFTINAIRSIYSFVPIDGPGLLQREMAKSGSISLYTYENPEALPRAHLVYEATVAATLSDAVSILRSNSFSPRSTVLLERHEIRNDQRIKQIISQPNKGETTYPTAHIDQEAMQKVDITVTDNPKDGILVLSDTMYPGWIASVDGVSTPIFTANLSHRAISVPKGTHTIQFSFRPKSVTLGIIVSTITIISIVVLAIAPFGVFLAHRFYTAHLLSSRHPHTHGR